LTFSLVVDEVVVGLKVIGDVVVVFVGLFVNVVDDKVVIGLIAGEVESAAFDFVADVVVFLIVVADVVDLAVVCVEEVLIIVTDVVSLVLKSVKVVELAFRSVFVVISLAFEVVCLTLDSTFVVVREAFGFFDVADLVVELVFVVVALAEDALSVVDEIDVDFVNLFLAAP
jgi:hypothetical protein